MENSKETDLPTYDGIGKYDKNGFARYGISAPSHEHNTIRLSGNVLKIAEDLLFVQIVTDDNVDMTNVKNELKPLEFNIPDFDPNIKRFRVFNWHDYEPVTTIEHARAVISSCNPSVLQKNKVGLDGNGEAPPEKCGNGVLTLV
jgi:protein tyrosine phosphatase